MTKISFLRYQLDNTFAGIVTKATPSLGFTSNVTEGFDASIVDESSGCPFKSIRGEPFDVEAFGVTVLILLIVIISTAPLPA